jgi:8-amino-3,8-dideoxy-alpha-D-manno-octulosonate transaminase|tara:strand:+ start:544 stop:1704 length:1161 start_codon:yes stop_codon:yes gene_type:complete
MPGFELINNEEKKALLKLFDKKDYGKRPLFRPRIYVKKFEQAFSKFIGSKYSCCVSSGTAAIKIALVAAGIKKGDEVLIQSFTFVAPVEAIVDLGAKPVLVNIDETLNMCPKDLEKKITKKSKVIMPVHMLGVAADMKEINKIAKKKKLIVIDDNCEALGAKWNKKQMLGVQSDMCTWSFDNGKTITTGEGGMITSNNFEFIKLCREYMDHGHENNPKFPRGRDTHRIYGFNFRPTEMTGVIGITQLKKINKILSKNKKNYYEIIKVFKKYKQIEFRKIPLKSSPLHDCIIFNFKNKKLSKKFVEIINNQGLVTKNVPDAIEWHFAMYWDHIFKRFGINKKRLKIILKKSHDLLERSVSIPIFVNDTKKKIKAKKKIFDEALKQVL